MRRWKYENQAFGRGKRYGFNLGLIVGFMISSLLIFIICNYQFLKIILN